LFQDSLSDNLQRANDDENHLKNVITSEKMRVYGYDTETNNSPHTGRVVLRIISKRKTSVPVSESNIACFFYHQRIVQ
jgi:hypothetical protein